MIQVGGNQGITSGFGQLVSLSGMGPNGADMTNDLTYAVLEVIDELSPILEPKPNVRLHLNSPDELLDKLVDMVASSQGAPFLLNFDERSMAGLLRQAKEAGCEHLINAENVHDYDQITGQPLPIAQDGPETGDARAFESWDRFWQAYVEQTRTLVRRCVDLHEMSESVRAEFCPTPYLSCLVRGCAEKGLDITQGGPEINFTTIEAVTFATTVDSLLAVKYLVFDEKKATMAELIGALEANWEGHETLQAWARFRAPKYGRDDDEADEMALRVMDLWTGETWKHQTVSTHRRFRPGMLSWNYWVGDGYIMAASADGRPKGQFLSNAICPSNGADINGPTANANSVGKALGGIAASGEGDWGDYRNSLPNGASHTMTFNPSLLRDGDHREKFKAFLRGYCRNGGTALQVNVIDAEMLRDAQKNPQNYRHLLVRVTGYNAYFTNIGRELQDEIIARVSHGQL